MAIVIEVGVEVNASNSVIVWVGTVCSVAMQDFSMLCSRDCMLCKRIKCRRVECRIQL